MGLDSPARGRERIVKAKDAKTIERDAVKEKATAERVDVETGIVIHQFKLQYHNWVHGVHSQLQPHRQRLQDMATEITQTLDREEATARDVFRTEMPDDQGASLASALASIADSIGDTPEEFAFVSCTSQIETALRILGNLDGTYKAKVAPALGRAEKELKSLYATLTKELPQQYATMSKSPRDLYGYSSTYDRESGMGRPLQLLGVAILGTGFGTSLLVSKFSKTNNVATAMYGLGLAAVLFKDRLLSTSLERSTARVIKRDIEEKRTQMEGQAAFLADPNGQFVALQKKYFPLETAQQDADDVAHFYETADGEDTGTIFDKRMGTQKKADARVKLRENLRGVGKRVTNDKDLDTLIDTLLTARTTPLRQTVVLWIRSGARPEALREFYRDPLVIAKLRELHEKAEESDKPVV